MDKPLRLEMSVLAYPEYGQPFTKMLIFREAATPENFVSLADWWASGGYVAPSETWMPTKFWRPWFLRICIDAGLVEVEATLDLSVRVWLRNQGIEV